MIRGPAVYMVCSVGLLLFATGSIVYQAGLLTPGSIYLLRLPNYVRQ